MSRAADTPKNRLVGLQVAWRQASLLRQDPHRRRAEGDTVMVGEQNIGPARTFQYSVRGPTLAFDAPADSNRRP